MGYFFRFLTNKLFLQKAVKNLFYNKTNCKQLLQDLIYF